MRSPLLFVVGVRDLANAVTHFKPSKRLACGPLFVVSRLLAFFRLLFLTVCGSYPRLTSREPASLSVQHSQRLTMLIGSLVASCLPVKSGSCA